MSVSRGCLGDEAHWILAVQIAVTKISKRELGREREMVD
jgi:hypothetical protein